MHVKSNSLRIETVLKTRINFYIKKRLNKGVREKGSFYLKMIKVTQ